MVLFNIKRDKKTVKGGVKEERNVYFTIIIEREGDMMGNSDNFRKGVMELLLLKIISEGDCYGYQISQTMKKLSDGVIVVAEGSMYTALNKLEKKGCVSDYRRRVGDRPERIYYHLENAGKEELNRLMIDYAEFTEAVKVVLAYAGEEKLKQRDII